MEKRGDLSPFFFGDCSAVPFFPSGTTIAIIFKIIFIIIAITIITITIITIIIIIIGFSKNRLVFIFHTRCSFGTVLRRRRDPDPYRLEQRKTPG